MNYAHQTNLIGPAQVNGQDTGYTLLTLLNDMLSQYNTYYNASAPLTQMSDVASASTHASPTRVRQRLPSPLHPLPRPPRTSRPSWRTR